MSTIAAIWYTHTGRRADFTRRIDTYYAAVQDGPAAIEIDEATYDALSAQETAADYREGGYIAFDRPIEWGDVFAEDRVP